jgi:hypothetical protein
LARTFSLACRQQSWQQNRRCMCQTVYALHSQTGVPLADNPPPGQEQLCWLLLLLLLVPVIKRGSCSAAVVSCAAPARRVSGTGPQCTLP